MTIVWADLKQVETSFQLACEILNDLQIEFALQNLSVATKKKHFAQLTVARITKQRFTTTNWRFAYARAHNRLTPGDYVVN